MTDHATDWQQIVDRHYPAGSPLRDIYLSHCRAVARKALDIARRRCLDLDPALIEGAAMTHDIGIYLTDAPGIHCHGTLPYICHSTAGAALLRREGAPEEWARVAERHTGSGLTAAEIRRSGMPLPEVDLLPQTELERLICYADKFFSKGSGSADPKPIDRIRHSMAKFGPGPAARFEALVDEFEPELTLTR